MGILPPDSTPVVLVLTVMSYMPLTLVLGRTVALVISGLLGVALSGIAHGLAARYFLLPFRYPSL
jgi:hypothetical protein